MGLINTKRIIDSAKREIRGKQPRFKFGDRLVVAGLVPRYEFIVGEIVFHGDAFRYSRHGGPQYREEGLELCQEPKKKKLYAYWDEDECGEYVKFREPKCHTTLRRAPEYDIEYPEGTNPNPWDKHD